MTIPRIPQGRHYYKPNNRALTAREQEILILRNQGRTGRQIADTLGITYSTVKSHVGKIKDKLDESA